MILFWNEGDEQDMMETEPGIDIFKAVDRADPPGRHPTPSDLTLPSLPNVFVRGYRRHGGTHRRGVED